MQQRNAIHTGMFNFTAALISLCLIVYVLIVGKSILIPVMFAVVIWYLMIRLAKLFARVPIIGLRIPDALAMTLAIVATIYIIYSFISLVGNSIYGIIEQAPLYQEKIRFIMNWISETTKGKVDLDKLVENFDLTSIFTNVAITLTNIASNLGIIFVYVLFLMLEYKTFDSKIRAMASNGENLNTSHDIIDKISMDINTYMKMKTLASLITGLASYIALKSFGISYAQFWALLIFILNYIPTIGSIIAVAITLLAVSIHFSSVTTFLLLAIILSTIQFCVGNILEPKLMGRNLNLSPMVIMLSLAFWGAIWGVAGMFLCVPLMTITNIVLSKFEQTRFLAVLFAADPDIVNPPTSSQKH